MSLPRYPTRRPAEHRSGSRQSCRTSRASAISASERTLLSCRVLCNIDEFRAMVAVGDDLDFLVCDEGIHDLLAPLVNTRICRERPSRNDRLSESPRPFDDRDRFAVIGCDVNMTPAFSGMDQLLDDDGDIDCIVVESLFCPVDRSPGHRRARPSILDRGDECRFTLDIENVSCWPAKLASGRSSAVALERHRHNELPC